MLIIRLHLFFVFFFFNDTATTEIYTLSLHDALPIFLASTATIWPTFRQEKFAVLQEVPKSNCVLLSVAMVKEGPFMPLWTLKVVWPREVIEIGRAHV